MKGSTLLKFCLPFCLAYLCAVPGFATPVRTPCVSGGNRDGHLSTFVHTGVLCEPATTPPTYAGGSDKTDAANPIQFAAIIVNGRKLTGPNSRARRRNGLLMIPVSIVARSLGDAVSVDVATRLVSVRRQNGLISDFDAQTGRVRENGLAVLLVSNPGAIIFSPSADDLFLGAEIVAALFDASIRYDDGQSAVLITRGQIQTDSVIKRDGQRFAEIYQIDYEYGLNRYSSTSSQGLNLTAQGSLADGRFHFSSNLDGISVTKMSMRNSTLNFERPNGQRFTGGDFGAGSNLQFLSANVRGGSASVPFGPAVVTAFAGRSFSGVFVPVVTDPTLDEPQISVRNRPRYDTNVFGFHATTLNPLSRRASPLTFSAGAMRFSGEQRSGDLISGSVNYDVSRFSVQGDFGFGKFSGTRPDNFRFSGSGAAVDVAGTLNLTDALTLHGRYAHVGQNFLSPQQGFREPTDLKSAGVRWSPQKWLTASIYASAVKRPGDVGQNNKFVTAAFGITLAPGLPTLFVSHTQSKTSQAGPAAFTLVNASKEFRRLRLFFNATRIKLLGPATLNANMSANYVISDRNSFEINQGIGSGKSLNGQFEWRTSNLLKQRLSLSAGVGYNYGSTAGFTTFERLSAAVKLPRQTSLQINYYQTNAGPTMLVSFRGSLFRKREAGAFLDSPLAEMNSFGKVSGRVYQDVDLNGKFDAGIDKPQSKVKVRVDGNRYVESDENGFYHFESVAAGDHKVYLDLLSIRADLTLLGSAAKEATFLAGTSSIFDFRLVRTGRISGRVWLDANKNGKLDDGEKPLADIRVVTASGRDTLTDADGYFVFGDLPPGEHIFLLDEKTLPAKTMAGFKPVAVWAFPGRETVDVNLPVIMIPAEVKRFGLKTSPPIQNPLR